MIPWLHTHQPHCLRSSAKTASITPQEERTVCTTQEVTCPPQQINDDADRPHHVNTTRCAEPLQRVSYYSRLPATNSHGQRTAPSFTKTEQTQWNNSPAKESPKTRARRWHRPRLMSCVTAPQLGGLGMQAATRHTATPGCAGHEQGGQGPRSEHMNTPYKLLNGGCSRRQDHACMHSFSMGSCNICMSGRDKNLEAIKHKQCPG